MNPIRNKKMEKISEKEGFRAGFVRLFGRYDFRNEEHFLHFGKWLIFVILVLVESLLLLQCLDGVLKKEDEWWKFFLLLGIEGALGLSMGIKLFVAKKTPTKIALYILDVIAACSFLFLVDNWYPFTMYILILTPVYFELKRMKQAWGILGVSIVVYMLAYALEAYIFEGVPVWNLLRLVQLTFGFIVGIATHFCAVQIALAFYRQYLKLNKTLGELAESKKELEKAYSVVAEVSALEERQRIAREMHDTVGHSLTTVIMQTEAAKRMMESSPKEAESKLVSANLRARQALEEIRSSVHLLSGGNTRQTLKAELTRIIHESMDGTGITIRFDVEDMETPVDTARFLCNTLKEGISNGLRHGNATAFWFELKKEDGKISFLLSDNGKGADGEISMGFGLTTMRQRAEALGGKATFFSDEEGFEIRIAL